MKNLSAYNKLWVALGAALAVTGAALSDGSLTQSEIIQVIVAFVGSLGVYQVKNQTK